MNIKLKDLYKNHQGRIAQKWSNYFDLYDRYLQKYIRQNVTLLEIGINLGGSLQLWKKYLGQNATIIGLDIEKKFMFVEDQIYTYCGDQNDFTVYDEITSNHGNFDIIIDDGSHKTPDVANTLKFLYPLLNDNGIYVIEDTHASYWREFNGSLSNELNIVDVLGKNVHSINKRYMDENYSIFLNDLKGISFYESIIFIEKEKIEIPDVIVAGKQDD